MAGRQSEWGIPPGIKLINNKSSTTLIPESYMLTFLNFITRYVLYAAKQLPPVGYLG